MIELKEEDYLRGVYRIYKNNETDKIWWVEHVDVIGEQMFTFDRKTFYHLFGDYPKKITKEQKELFDKENPYWAEFFEGI